MSLKPKSDPSQSHIRLEKMWAYRTKEASLSDEERHHMIECDECLSLSGLCQICNSLSQVQRRLKEQQD